MEMRCVRLFTHEGMTHDGQRIHDWLFRLAQSLGIPGGSVFRASAGYGRHGLHEDVFFELAGDLPETVEFVARTDQVTELLRRVGGAGLRLRYVIHDVDTGLTCDPGGAGDQGKD